MQVGNASFFERQKNGKDLDKIVTVNYLAFDQFFNRLDVRFTKCTTKLCTDLSAHSQVRWFMYNLKTLKLFNSTIYYQHFKTTERLYINK